MTAVAEQIGAWLAAATVDDLPEDALDTARRLFLDVTGLCIAARHEAYVDAALHAVDAGTCTALGHPGAFDAFGAALVNGTAAHGEDFDDTFEGGPVHSGAVIVPAVLAACEREQLTGQDALRGVVTGVELMCRLSLVAPMATHNAGFHPTAVFGAMAAAGGVGAALGLTQIEIASALGIAGSMASGIIEYLAEGTWTKRMHAGWAAQSGVRAALLARGGFRGPRTVFEGTHGLYHAFAPSVQPDFEPLLAQLGRQWVMPTVAFKPYACGTMTQPYVDCAIRMAQDGVKADQIIDVVCNVAQGTVPRLWEPLASKHRPPTPYAAKFSTPFCMAIGFFDRNAGLAQFTEKRIEDPALGRLAAKIRYAIDPANEYPNKFTGHLRATLQDGSQREYSQPCLRGGVDDPLSLEELEAKFRANTAYGRWPPALAERVIARLGDIFTSTTIDMTEFRA